MNKFTESFFNEIEKVARQLSQQELNKLLEQDLNNPKGLKKLIPRSIRKRRASNKTYAFYDTTDQDYTVYDPKTDFVGRLSSTQKLQKKRKKHK